MPTEPRSPIRRPSASDAARRALALETASSERRRRLTHRLAPAMLGLAIVAFLLGLIVGSGQSESERVGRDFAAAWQRGNYGAMHDMLTPAAKAQITPEEFATAYRDAAATATATSVDPGKAECDGDR